MNVDMTHKAIIALRQGYALWAEICQIYPNQTNNDGIICEDLEDFCHVVALTISFPVPARTSDSEFINNGLIRRIATGN